MSRLNSPSIIIIITAYDDEEREWSSSAVDGAGKLIFEGSGDTGNKALQDLYKKLGKWVQTKHDV